MFRIDILDAGFFKLSLKKNGFAAEFKRFGEVSAAL